MKPCGTGKERPRSRALLGGENKGRGVPVPIAGAGASELGFLEQPSLLSVQPSVYAGTEDVLMAASLSAALLANEK
jgi:hypothetical protein